MTQVADHDGAAAGTAAMPAPARGRHIPALDGVRGLAVLTVFLFHFGGGTHSSMRAMQVFGFVNKGGWSGVVLFFVLSGFLITGILWDGFSDPRWWPKFFARRSLRILPLYYLILLATVVCAIPGGTAGKVLSGIWVPALFLENLPRLAGISESLPSPVPLFHLWSIAVEEQFYLVWPFLLLAARTRDRAKMLCVAVFGGAIVFQALVHALTPGLNWTHSLPVQAGALALGGWLALAYRGPEWPAVLRAAPWVLTTGLLCFLAVGLHAGGFDGNREIERFGLPAISLGFTGLVALAVRPGRVARVFGMAWLRWLGNISYGLYVFHVALLGPIHHVTDRLSAGRPQMVVQAVQFVVAAVLSVAAAVISYHVYEKQFLKLKRFFIPKPRPIAAAEPQPVLAGKPTR